MPYLFLTCGRWQHYHQPTDTPDRLDYAKMGRIRDYLVRLTEALAQSAPLGWFYFFSQWLPITAVGLVYLNREGLSLRSLGQAQTETA